MHHKHRDTLTLGQIMISLWYPAWDQAHRDHVKKKRKNSKHKRGMTAITAVLGLSLSVPPRSKWVVYKHNFSVTGLQSQGGSFQSKGHKFSAKQSRLVKKKKNPLQTLGSRWEKKWKDALTNGAHQLLLCLTNTSFMRAQPTFRPDRQIESPLFYFKLLQMTTGDVIWIYSASLFICFLFGFLFFWEQRQTGDVRLDLQESCSSSHTHKML